MLTHKYLSTLALAISILLFCGCEKKTDKVRITIEQDGPIYTIYPDELNGTSEHTQYVKDYLNRNIAYDNKLNDDGSHVYVNNDIYNFLVMIPMKTKENFPKLTLSGAHVPGHMYLKRCGGTNNVQFLAFSTHEYILDVNNTYHYTLNAYSNEMETQELLSRTSDLCIKYENFGEDMDYINDHQSNTITIKAQEIKDMLDNLGIVYE